jgi:hypothetical protein
MAILDVMTDEFPGYRSHALIRRGTALRRYEYVTTTDPATLERWLTLLLVDMGLDPAATVALSVRPGTILIERVLPAVPAQSAGGGGGKPPTACHSRAGPIRDGRRRWTTDRPAMR